MIEKLNILFAVIHYEDLKNNQEIAKISLTVGISELGVCVQVMGRKVSHARVVHHLTWHIVANGLGPSS